MGGLESVKASYSGICAGAIALAAMFSGFGIASVKADDRSAEIATPMAAATNPAAAPADAPTKIELPTRDHPLVITITPAFSKALQGVRKKAPKPPASWSAQEVSAAKARCNAILKKINAVAIPEQPMKNGGCGAPAPVQLISIGTNPQVALSPPATLTCEMAEALHTWLQRDLQPLARRHFGSKIIKIEVMSSYSCRNAYGRKLGKLSEHGRANALDIRGFVTASAQTANILRDWGKPQREIIAEIKAAKNAEAKAEAIKAAAEAAARRNQLARGTPDTPSGAAALTKSTIAEGIPSVTIKIPGAEVSASAPSLYGFAAPSKLGGASLNAEPPAKKRQFLRAAQASACKIFNTTLGPEANKAHRHHLHIDMAKRKVDIKICE